MKAKIVEQIEEIPAPHWNTLVPEAHPFLRHEFLVALERHDCVGPRFGWLPRHLALFDQGQLIGAAPQYQKSNSYGELVFDGSWADAFTRAGLPYYPKLVVAVPYTPATGPRLLLIPDRRREPAAEAMLDAALEQARQSGVSSLHWLFLPPEEAERLGTRGLFRRTGCQFHWHNPGYRDFADFLENLSSKKRKNLKRERRLVHSAGLKIEVLEGAQATEAQWASFHRFYCSTFERKGGIPTLRLGFFQEIGRTMGDQIILVLASNGPRYVAGALMFRSDHTLYGRHWGCLELHDGLHFEVCYYQGLEYAIRNGLRHFEPGAQGEFKISRGFLPAPTYSSHWLAHPEFHDAIERHTRHEEQYVNEYMDELGERSPYRKSGT